MLFLSPVLVVWTLLSSRSLGARPGGHRGQRQQPPQLWQLAEDSDRRWVRAPLPAESNTPHDEADQVDGSSLRSSADADDESGAVNEDVGPRIGIGSRSSSNDNDIFNDAAERLLGSKTAVSTPLTASGTGNAELLVKRPHDRETKSKMMKAAAAEEVLEKLGGAAEVLNKLHGAAGPVGKVLENELGGAAEVRLEKNEAPLVVEHQQMPDTSSPKRSRDFFNDKPFFLEDLNLSRAPKAGGDSDAHSDPASYRQGFFPKIQGSFNPFREPEDTPSTSKVAAPPGGHLCGTATADQKETLLSCPPPSSPPPKSVRGLLSASSSDEAEICAPVSPLLHLASERSHQRDGHSAAVGPHQGHAAATSTSNGCSGPPSSNLARQGHWAAQMQPPTESKRTATQKYVRTVDESFSSSSSSSTEVGTAAASDSLALSPEQEQPPAAQVRQPSLFSRIKQHHRQTQTTPDEIMTDEVLDDPRPRPRHEEANEELHSRAHRQTAIDFTEHVDDQEMAPPPPGGEHSHDSASGSAASFCGAKRGNSTSSSEDRWNGSNRPKSNFTRKSLPLWKRALGGIFAAAAIPALRTGFYHVAGAGAPPPLLRGSYRHGPELQLQSGTTAVGGGLLQQVADQHGGIFEQLPERPADDQGSWLMRNFLGDYVGSTFATLDPFSGGANDRRLYWNSIRDNCAIEETCTLEEAFEARGREALRKATEPSGGSGRYSDPWRVHVSPKQEADDFVTDYGRVWYQSPGKNCFFARTCNEEELSLCRNFGASTCKAEGDARGDIDFQYEPLGLNFSLPVAALAVTGAVHACGGGFGRGRRSYAAAPPDGHAPGPAAASSESSVRREREKNAGFSISGNSIWNWSMSMSYSERERSRSAPLLDEQPDAGGSWGRSGGFRADPDHGARAGPRGPSIFGDEMLRGMSFPPSGSPRRSVTTTLPGVSSRRDAGFLLGERGSSQQFPFPPGTRPTRSFAPEDGPGGGAAGVGGEGRSTATRTTTHSSPPAFFFPDEQPGAVGVDTDVSDVVMEDSHSECVIPRPRTGVKDVAPPTSFRSWPTWLEQPERPSLPEPEPERATTKEVDTHVARPKTTLRALGFHTKPSANGARTPLLHGNRHDGDDPKRQGSSTSYGAMRHRLARSPGPYDRPPSSPPRGQQS